MIFLPMAIVLFLLFLIALPFLLIFGFFHIVTVGFENLGLSTETTLAILLLMLIGSLFNIPLGQRGIMEVEQTSFFGLVRRRKMIATGISINVGGALVPAALAIYFLSQVPLKPALIATGVMIAISFFSARYVPNKGITVPILIPAILAAITAYIVSSEHMAPIAFISGVFGMLVGADLLHLLRVRGAMGILSIGGAGVFDGIFLIAVISALLAGF